MMETMGKGKNDGPQRRRRRSKTIHILHTYIYITIMVCWMPYRLAYTAMASHVHQCLGAPAVQDQEKREQNDNIIKYKLKVNFLLRLVVVFMPIIIIITTTKWLLWLCLFVWLRRARVRSHTAHQQSQPRQFLFVRWIRGRGRRSLSPSMASNQWIESGNNIECVWFDVSLGRDKRRAIGLYLCARTIHQNVANWINQRLQLLSDRIWTVCVCVYANGWRTSTGHKTNNNQLSDAGQRDEFRSTYCKSCVALALKRILLHPIDKML